MSGNNDDDLPVVNLDFLTEDEELAALVKDRYRMPAEVIAAMREAGLIVSLKLLKLVKSEEFDKLPVKEKLKVTDMILDRAFGRSESASSNMAAMHRIDESKEKESNEEYGTGRRLKEIEARAKQIGGFPEMRTARRATTNPKLSLDEANGSSASKIEETFGSPDADIPKDTSNGNPGARRRYRGEDRDQSSANAGSSCNSDDVPPRQAANVVPLLPSDERRRRRAAALSSASA